MTDIPRTAAQDRFPAEPSQGRGSSIERVSMSASDHDAALDEIDSLRQQVEELTRQRDAACLTRNQLHVENVRLTAERNDMCSECMDTLAETVAERDTLTAQLAEFAEIAGLMYCVTHDEIIDERNDDECRASDEPGPCRGCDLFYRPVPREEGKQQ